MATFSHITSPLQSVPGMEPQADSIRFPYLLKRTDGEIVGDSAAMKRLRLQVRRIGPHFRAVLIHGEGGTGKKMVARSLHKESIRTDGPFVAAASGNRISYLMKIARGGTLFFHGIDEAPLETQDELLEALRRQEWSQEGLAAPQKLSTRIIATTKQDLKGFAASGRFRQELYQRIAMVQIGVPPLRERMEDVPALAMHFLAGFERQYRQTFTIAKKAMELLQSHRWPGNVQEMESALENVVLQNKGGEIQAWELTLSTTSSEVNRNEASEEVPMKTARLQEVVDRHVLRVLHDCAGNKLRAAELLGISRSTLYRMLDSCSLQVADTLPLVYEVPGVARFASEKRTSHEESR
ncbi:MAG TPA: sigma 54-interacting transcriptional regulator [Edaphobacter sp.]|uniref:sigma-54-dependent transcriptional regulator n=1 Tax=Edaphobacter sp. TaxID=1934404 RepID=UPI002BEF6476|nr:sigma 54-interacting transcriptional regulator [Edaphobacter sp.]HUZ97151.1 sigma 54-interacting transcriptional regulator [Edaphobacter sp.]